MSSNIKDSFEFVKKPTVSPVYGIPVPIASPSLPRKIVNPAPAENHLESNLRPQSKIPSSRASLLNLAPGSSASDLHPSSHRTEFNLPGPSKSIPALPQSSKNHPPSSHSGSSSAHPKVLCSKVLGEAEPFIFSPRIYNEKYLLQTYPKTFLTPQKVDVLDVTADQLISTIEEVMVRQGKPLVIQNFHLLSNFDQELFSLEWLKANKKRVEVSIRDLKRKKDISMPFDEFLAANEGRSYKNIRYYGKDLDCPEEWHDSAKGLLMPYLHYLGCNDMNSYLPNYLKIENLMIYVGHEGTHTASHFDICGSVGHNLMLQADKGCSALWFMVERDNADKARKYWYKHGGGNSSLDQDNLSLTADVMGQADFPIYMFEQQLGDFVMVPSECAHQVVNLGQGTTIKYSYNRCTVQSLEHCINKILPVNRRILKTETYRIKTMVEKAVLKLGRRLESNRLVPCHSYSLEKIALDFGTLLRLYAQIISMDVVDSSYTFKSQLQPKLADDQEHHTRTCDYCHCDIWNSWFQCKECDPQAEHDFCANCLAENRTCNNFAKLTWVCHRTVKSCFKDLQRFSKLYNSLPLLQKASLFSPVPEYLRISELKQLRPHEYSPMTLAVRNLTAAKEGFKAKCHHCQSFYPENEMVFCSRLHSHSYCHRCLACKYAEDPAELALKKDWQCYCCREVCNSTRCVRNNKRCAAYPTPKRRLCQADFNGNYCLAPGLSYFPVGEAEFLTPSLVDAKTYHLKRRAHSPATVQAHLNPVVAPPNPPSEQSKSLKRASPCENAWGAYPQKQPKLKAASLVSKPAFEKEQTPAKANSESKEHRTRPIHPYAMATAPRRHVYKPTPITNKVRDFSGISKYPQHVSMASSTANRTASLDSRAVPHHPSSKVFNQGLREPKLAYPSQFPPSAQRLPKPVSKEFSNTSKQSSRAAEPQVLIKQGCIKRKYSDGPESNTQDQKNAAKKPRDHVPSTPKKATAPSNRQLLSTMVSHKKESSASQSNSSSLPARPSQHQSHPRRLDKQNGDSEFSSQKRHG